MLLLLACTAPLEDTATKGEDSGDLDTAETGETGDTTDTGSTEANRWTILVYMDGDNDLEEYVPHDLNELEASGEGGGVTILVQADRIDGYSSYDGDWTGTRRYRIVSDTSTTVKSEVVEDLGELDMGDPQTLSDFLAWGTVEAPAEHYALVLWDHGSSWELQGGGAPPPGVASDDTSGTMIGIADGSLRAALDGNRLANGPLDLIGFDACSMASWEVAYDLRDHADALIASSTSVGGEGFDYARSIAWLRETPDATGADLGGAFAEGARDLGEYTQSVIDLTMAESLVEAVDELADAALADPDALASLMAARDAARGADPVWRAYYLDLGDLAAQASADPVFALASADVASRLAEAIPYNYTNDPFLWSSGMTIMADTRDQTFLNIYGLGSWSAGSRWDEALQAMRDAEVAAE